MYSVICPYCNYINHFGRDCVYYDAYECFSCAQKSYFDDMIKSESDTLELNNGKVECIVGKMYNGSDV